jgi:hypothetical protein
VSFDDVVQIKDPDQKMEPMDIFATTLARTREQRVEDVRDKLKAKISKEPSQQAPAPPEQEPAPPAGDAGLEEDAGLDLDELYRRAAIEYLDTDEEFNRWLARGEIPWRGVLEALKRGLPDDNSVPDPDRWAHELVPVALERVLGKQDEAWHSKRREKRDDPTRTVLWVIIGAR